MLFHESQCDAMSDESEDNPTESAAKYRCPGQASPISRSVHLGRLAQFYPGCRQCRFREDTGVLSARHVARLAETRHRGLRTDLFHNEGAGGVYLNDLGPAEARRMAVALGFYLIRDDVDGQTTAPSREPPLAVIAGDGRPEAPELVAAVSEGLRWTGCGVIDAGQTTAPCLMAAIAAWGAAGGILVGNPSGRPETVGLKFWAGSARPLSDNGPLRAIQRRFETPPERPTRRFGPLVRRRAEGLYLDALADSYHALRPLRIVAQSTCRLVVDHLEKLTATVACEVLRHRGPSDRLGERVRDEGAHFGIHLGDDGETAAVFDERGREAPSARLLLLLARHLLALIPEGHVVVERGIAPGTVERMVSMGGRVKTCGGYRAEMDREMRRHGAVLGGGANGRFWCRLHGDPALPDALQTLTLLLTILSQSDRPLSVVLDADASLP